MTTITAPDTSAFEALDAALQRRPRRPRPPVVRRRATGLERRDRPPPRPHRPLPGRRRRGGRRSGFARDHDLPASVRGGGHAVAGHAVLDDGLVIDLSAMTGTRVDPVARTIQLEGGACNAHLDRETQAFGLAATGGFVSHTGVAGLTLGGGIGHLMRRFGLAIDALRECDVVTADGDVRDGQRGGERRPLLGAARRRRQLRRRHELRRSTCSRSGPTGARRPGRLAGRPGADACWRSCATSWPTPPTSSGLMANLRLAPPLPRLPDRRCRARRSSRLVVTWAGDIEAGEALPPAAACLRHPARRTRSRRSPTPPTRRCSTPAVPHGRHYYWKSHRLGPLTDDVIDIICRHLGRITSPMSSVPIFCFGGAMARVPEDATAFPHRDAAHDINIVGVVAARAGRRVGPAPGVGAGLLRRPRAPQPRRLRELHLRRRAVTGCGEAYSPTQWDAARGGSRRRTTRRTSSVATPTSSRPDAAA